jgi:type IV secretory pathway VirB6-like protein
MIHDDECGTVGGMRIGRGNRSTRRKPAPVPLCPPLILIYLTNINLFNLILIYLILILIYSIAVVIVFVIVVIVFALYLLCVVCPLLFV